MRNSLSLGALERMVRQVAQLESDVEVLEARCAELEFRVSQVEPVRAKE